jgi:hypothetical protein
MGQSKLDKELNWQELEREEEKYDKSRKHKDRRAYKRIRIQGRWWEETEENGDSEDFREGEIIPKSRSISNSYR